MAREIVFDNFVFMGVNTKKYLSRKDNKEHEANNAKLYDMTTDENHDYYISPDLAEKLRAMPKMKQCKIYLSVSVFNGQASLSLVNIEILK